MVHNASWGIMKTIQTDAHTHMYIQHTHTLRHTWKQNKEAKRILGNNNPTHFLSFLAVNCNGLEYVHAHVQVMTYEACHMCASEILNWLSCMRAPLLLQ